MARIVFPQQILIQKLHLFRDDSPLVTFAQPEVTAEFIPYCTKMEKCILYSTVVQCITTLGTQSTARVLVSSALPASPVCSALTTKNKIQLHATALDVDPNTVRD